MRIQIDLNIPFPMWARRATQVGIVALVLGASAVALGVPSEFVANTPLSSKALNDNFKDLDTRLGAVVAKPTVTKNQKAYSLGATYCGKTTPVAGAAIGGYGSAKSLCEAAAVCGGSASAHMCTLEELTRTAQMSIQSAAGWYATGSYATAGTPVGPVRDCVGWGTANASNDFGPVWDSNGPSGVAACTSAQPVLCCD